MIVAIDGPAGAGKSSAARALAQRLGLRFLDTGAMYRVATLAVLRAGLDESRPDDVLQVVRDSEIEVADAPRLGGEDVSAEIRQPELARKIYIVADLPRAREVLSQRQREFAAACAEGIVTEGRDQGTEVFPEADCKVFLTARPETRAERRAAELARDGVQIEVDQLRRDIELRDRRDAARPVGALRQAPDAVALWTDELSFDEVVDRLVEIVHASAPDWPVAPGNASTAGRRG